MTSYGMTREGRDLKENMTLLGRCLQNWIKIDNSNQNKVNNLFIMNNWSSNFCNEFYFFNYRIIDY